MPYKNKGASRCHRRTFLSECFHKEPLTSEEPFCFTKDALWWKKVLQIIKKLRKRWFFKEPLTEWSKNGSSMASLEEPLFLRLYITSFQTSQLLFWVFFMFCQLSNCHAVKLHYNQLNTLYFYHSQPLFHSCQTSNMALHNRIYF